MHVTCVTSFETHSEVLVATNIKVKGVDCDGIRAVHPKGDWSTPSQAVATTILVGGDGGSERGVTSEGIWTFSKMTI